MAAIANHKDNLLQGATYRFDSTLSEVDWTEVVDHHGLKPEDNATYGAEFDANILGTADTYYLKEHAVTNYDFAETTSYLSGTETLSVSIGVTPMGGSVLLFVSFYFSSNYSATSGYSEAVMTITHNGDNIFNMPMCQVPNAGGVAPIALTLSEKILHSPGGFSQLAYLMTEDAAFLMTEDGNYLVSDIIDESVHTYTVNLTYDATGDGSRGQLTHLACYAVVLKR